VREIGEPPGSDSRGAAPCHDALGGHGGEPVQPLIRYDSCHGVGWGRLNGHAAAVAARLSWRRDPRFRIFVIRSPGRFDGVLVEYCLPSGARQRNFDSILFVLFLVTVVQSRFAVRLVGGLDAQVAAAERRVD
jgi:hypothetical protein